MKKQWVCGNNQSEKRCETKTHDSLKAHTFETKRRLMHVHEEKIVLREVLKLFLSWKRAKIYDVF